jgi:hypothetical protein
MAVNRRLRDVTTEELVPGMIVFSKYFDDDLGLVVCLRRSDSPHEFEGMLISEGTPLWDVTILWSNGISYDFESTTVWSGFEWRIPWKKNK